jgi:hypothetical protein
MSVQVTVTKKQGNVMGTVIARVSDPGVLVRDVNFYIEVPGRSRELGPYPPDIVRRPSPGVYEKDVVLDPDFQTRVRIDVLTEPGGAVSFTGATVQEFDARTATVVGGTGEVRVRDASMGPTAADTIAIEGAVVTVTTNKLATFNLDGRYPTHGGVGGALASYYTKAESDGRFHPLAGAIVAQGIQANRDSSPSSGGVALYPIPGAPDTFGVFLRGATHGSAWGHHGYVTGDWNVYLNIDNSPARGWVFRNSATGNVASIRNDGAATFGFVRSPGGARVGPHLDVGVGTHGSSIRRPDGGPMYLQSGGGGYVVVGDPLLTAYRFSVLGDVYAEGGWLRTNGTQGWYNETFGGGIHMEGPNWVRVYNGKGFLVPGNIKTFGAFYGSGSSVRLNSDESYWYATTNGGMQFYGIDGGRKGYVYHDASGFGLLHGGGGWAVRANPGTTDVFGMLRMHNDANLASSSGGGWINFDAGNTSHGAPGAYRGLYWGDQTTAYGIYKGPATSPGGPFAQLRIAYHTGIQVGAQTQYGGVRFYSNEEMSNDGVAGVGGHPRHLLFSVANGSNNVSVHHDSQLVFGPNSYGQYLLLGGNQANGSGHAHILTTNGNLHIDSKAGNNTYINHVNGRPVNIGGIEQSTYKLAVWGDAILHGGGWFRNGAAGHGLYNEATANHLYAAFDTHDNVWNMTGNGDRPAALCLRTGYGSGFTSAQGWLYGHGGQFGLLDSTRNWKVRVHGSGVQFYGSSLTDADGNQLAAIKAVTAAPGPDTPGRVGTIYVLVTP